MIVLGDADEARAKAIREILEREFTVGVLCVSSWVRVEKAISDPLTRFALILLSEDLPYHESKLLPALDHFLWHLETHGWPNVVVVYSGPQPKQELPPGASAIQFAPTADGFVTKLGVFLTGYDRLPRASLENEAALREQVRDLDIDQHDQKRGERVLEQLVARFFDWPTVTVGQLTPGLSGARVFRIEGDGTYVLKLARDTDRWKLEQEVKRNPLVPGGVANVRLNKPGLKECRYGEQGNSHIASHGRWCAVCYDYLGGKEFGELLDLHTALTAPPAKLPSDAKGGLEDFRRRRLGTLLGWLRGNWYEKGAQRESKEIWDTRHGDDYRYEDFPPYRLAARHKSAILRFLHSEEATLLGPRRMKDWDEHKNRVWSFVGDGTCPPELKVPLPVVLSAAHGDLNSHNAFLWEEFPDQPFLIDFPMFQKRGHALQDFARVEVEIKIMLMDQQPGTAVKALPALGWTWGQLALWRQLEDHLLSKDWKDDFACKGRGCAENVHLSFELVRDLRKQAWGVQQQTLSGGGPPDFRDEYRPALLYHTLRAITYSVPIFKRLLAVYSASRLLQQAGLT